METDAARTAGLISERQSIRTLLAQGMDSFARGDMSGAVADFSRVLLLDDGNRDAAEYLAKIRFETGLTGEEKIRLLLWEDLLAFNAALKGKIDFLNHKIDILIRQLEGRGYDPSWIREQIAKIKTVVLEKEEDGGARPFSSAEPNPLTALTEHMLRQKKDLFSRLAALQSQYEWLNELSKAKTGRIFDGPITADISIGPELGESDLGLLKREVALLRREFDVLQERVAQRDQRIVELTQQIVDLALQLSEKDRELTKKLDSFNSLNQQFSDLQSRWELGQKILEEKNAHIELLKKTVGEMAAQTRNVEIKDKPQSLRIVKELEGMLEIYKSKLGESDKALKNRTQNFSSLQGRMAFLQDRLDEKDQLIEKTKKDLTVLENQLLEIQNKLLLFKSRAPFPENKENSPEVRNEIEQMQSRLKEIHVFLGDQMKYFDP